MSEAPSKPEPTPASRFREAMKQIVSVPKTEILRREDEDRRQRAAQKQKKRAA